VYLREAYGERIAFLYGWMSLLVMDPGVTAALAVGGATYAAFIFGWNFGVSKLIAVLAIAAICLVNMLNTRAAAGVLRYATWLKFAILALLVIWALVFRLGSWSHFVPFVAQRPGSQPLLPAIAGAVVAAFYSFGGWWDVSKIAGEVKDPVRTLPRALVLGVLGVVAAYVVVSGVFLYLVPIESVTSDQTFVAQAGTVLFGKAGADILSAAVVICVVGSVAALVMVCPRVYYAMARDGVFLHVVAQLHPHFGTLVRAIGIQGMLTALLVAIGAFVFGTDCPATCANTLPLAATAAAGLWGGTTGTTRSMPCCGTSRSFLKMQIEGLLRAPANSTFTVRSFTSGFFHNV